MNILEMAMAAKMGGGNGGGSGGGTGASSWNAVTGKPFDANNIIKPEALPEGYPYKEKGETVLLEPTTFEMGMLEGGLVGSQGRVDHNLQVGKTYIVTWNGAKYECEAVDAEGGMDGMIGNAGLISGIVSEVPFLIGFSDNPYMNFMILTEATGTYTVSIAELSETIHTMAPEFLPAGVGVPTVTADDNGKFLRVVNGAWVAVALESAEGGSF